MPREKYDLLIRGGRVVDPAQRLDAIRDVAIRGDRIAAVAERIDGDADRVIDATGLIVTPGLIDIHVHVYPGVSHFGIDPDPHCLGRGVTTAVDAGSAGAATFAGLRRYVVEASETRLYAMLNISAAGMISMLVGELEDIKWASVSEALKVVEANRDKILGIKVRMSKSLVGSNGLRPLALAREAADAAGLPVMIHPNDAPGTMEEMLDYLRPGDVMTHCFHRSDTGVLDADGRVRPKLRQMVERGLALDLGHGKGSFSFRVAEQALTQDLQPTTISTDLHVYNLPGPVHDMATTLSKMMHLGIPLADALAKVTAAPARLFKWDAEIGSLRPGLCADVAAFKLESGRFELEDTAGEKRTAEQMLTPRLVIRAGRPVDVTARADRQTVGAPSP